MRVFAVKSFESLRGDDIGEGAFTGLSGVKVEMSLFC